MKSEAYFLIRYGQSEQAFERRPIELESAKEGELCIEVESFGLNYADVMARNKLYREAPPLPAVLGYEVVGKVVEVGSSDQEQLLDRRVLAFTRFGGYGKHVVTKVSACVPIDDLSGNKALALATQYVTAYYMSEHLSPLRKGDHVLIHAASGGVGIALIQLAKRAGATVIAKVGSDEKMEFARNMGADHVINYKKQDYVQEVKDWLGTKRLDVVFNPVAGKTFKWDLGLLGSGGRLFLYGGSDLMGRKWGVFSGLNFMRQMGLLIPIAFMMRSKSLLGVNMLKVADYKEEVLQNCLEEVVRLTQKGELNPPEGRMFDHNQLAQAHTLLESGTSIGKIGINW
ncbi:MAG: alcohol dehydrogenase [Bacteroidetes bacterium]|nr:MAG: alcohol dehydrogenase [Bacteroidota bacterium]